MHGEGGSGHASGAIEKFLRLTPSRTSGTALLASRTKITFVIDPYSEKECMSISESLPLLPDL